MQTDTTGPLSDASRTLARCDFPSLPKVDTSLVFNNCSVSRDTSIMGIKNIMLLIYWRGSSLSSLLQWICVPSSSSRQCTQLIIEDNGHKGYWDGLLHDRLLYRLLFCARSLLRYHLMLDLSRGMTSSRDSTVVVPSPGNIFSVQSNFAHNYPTI